MDAQVQPVEGKPIQENLLRLIAVSAEELADAIHEGDGSDVSEMIARVLDDRQAA